MKILAVDTSTRHLTIAVTEGDKILSSRNVRPKKDLSLTITFDIERALQKANVRLSDLDAFVVGLGPGSFTGLRVGFSMMKAFIMVTEKPVVGIPSLDAIAMNVKTPKASRICVVNDARRGLVYSALYEKRDGGLVRHSEYFLKPIEEILPLIQGDVLFIGDAAAMVKDAVLAYAQAKNMPFTPRFASSRVSLPYASELARLGYQRLLRGDRDKIETLVPLYLYPEDCQVSHPWTGKKP